VYSGCICRYDTQCVYNRCYRSRSGAWVSKL